MEGTRSPGGPAPAVPLAEAADPARFGGKAAGLAAALACGLPVPDGFALAWDAVAAIAAGTAGTAGASGVVAAAEALGGALVVRSSAVGEDSAEASFAGQHLTVVNVNPPAVPAAVAAVWRSADEPSALAYRRRLGQPDRVRVGVVVQRLVHAETAGVLMDRNPLTGEPEVVVEAAWGLGEAVVAGLVTPDFVRLGPDGAVREHRPGVKDVAVRVAPGGGTEVVAVPEDRQSQLCLGDADLARLHRLAAECAACLGEGQDLEWAFSGGELWLLQRRPLTAPGRG